MSSQLIPPLKPDGFYDFMNGLIDIGGTQLFFERTNDIYIRFNKPFYIYGPNNEDKIFEPFLSIYNKDIFIIQNK